MKYLPIIFTLFAGGCSSKYITPDISDSNTASITVKHLSKHQNSTTTVNVYNNEECNETAGFGRLALVGDKFFVPSENLTTSVKASDKLFMSIRAGGNQPVGTGYYRPYECNKLVSFTPKKGSEYEISIMTPEFICKVKVIDNKTGINAEGLKFHEFKNSCRGNYVY